jgi:tetratricopeptide (TPR) repeat protein
MSSRIHLPPVPDRLAADPVAAWSEPMTIDSYLPLEPSRYPAFLDARVYQGSSGKVFPLPFHERISQVKHPHSWQAVHLENEWVRLVILPELGGRIYIGYDKTADYDFFYRNNVIKPALVGLAGPWLSGGVEFNWPQHHRPGTFLPTDVEIERESDGSVTIWCSDHDPFTRMKGMHGIRLRPGSTVVEARVRLYNRTEDTQTFLWWANVAAAVGDDYQSFFPTDVHWVADHAKRGVASFPRVDGTYYGIDYPSRVTPECPDGDRIDWYRNIPVPTSYMVASTRDDFFGGYDHGRQAGFVHWADRSVAPGKKQWTWGNSPFGWAWDRNLTDDDGPYVELMAGVYTDNQPDFSWIAPGETKLFSQYWFPIQRIGPAQFANLDAAVRLEPIDGGRRLRLGIATTRVLEDALVRIQAKDDQVVYETQATIVPGKPLLHEFSTGMSSDANFRVSVMERDSVILAWSQNTDGPGTPPRMATEPSEPSAIRSSDELFLTGQYLEQYRHATRSPEPYWLEAVSRDAGDVRSHLSLGALAERAHRYDDAERHFRSALERLLDRVPNPADGEAHYRLGINLVRQGRDDEAAEYLAKAAWVSAWRVPAGYALSALHARRRDYAASAEALRRVLALDSEHLQATTLLALMTRALGDGTAAQTLLSEQLSRDPLDQWTRDAAGLPLTTDAPTLLDVALEYRSAGMFADALRLLELAIDAAHSTPLGQVQVGILAEYHRARILDGLGDSAGSASGFARARTSTTDHALPSRLADVDALEFALEFDPTDSVAAALLGSWHYDKQNYDHAIDSWSRAVDFGLDVALGAVTHRNLGIAYFNARHDPQTAVAHLEAARILQPDDAKLLYEHDQLEAHIGTDAATRRERLGERLDLVSSRDDLTVTYVGLLTESGDLDQAERMLRGRLFQPWEGGEGLVLDAWEGVKTAQARRALSAGNAETARAHVVDAIEPPQSLGEGRHPLTNASELLLLLGDAESAAGRDLEARKAWTEAADYVGDFTGMATHRYSDRTIWSILALRRLGDPLRADALLAELAAFTEELAASPAKIDFFATSLPALLLFHEDPQKSRDAYVATLRGQLSELRTENVERHIALS